MSKKKIVILGMLCMIPIVGILSSWAVSQSSRRSEPQRLIEVRELVTRISELGLVGVVDSEYNVTGVSTPMGGRMERARNPDLPKLSEQDCRILGKLLKLQQAYLHKSGITDGGVRHLRDLRELRTLNLAKTPISDAAIKHIRNLLELETLILEFTDITDAGLAELRDLRKLKRLSLCETRVTHVGLDTLETFKNLEQLTLSAAQLSKTGIEHVTSLTNLKELAIYNRDQVADEAVQAIKTSLPDCVVCRYEYSREVPWPVWAETIPPSFFLIEDGNKYPSKPIKVLPAFSRKRDAKPAKEEND